MTHDAANYGFDDDGQIVPVVWPEDDEIEPAHHAPPTGLMGETLSLVLRAGNIADIGARSAMLGFLVESPNAPTSLRELGRVLGCSHVTASARLNRFKAEMLRELRPDLTGGE
jgi:hypothetical protein